MKTVAYKKTGNGIEKITNDFDKLKNSSPETVLMDKYQDLFDRIDRGSQVVNFVKTSEYQDSLKDVLQAITLELIESKTYLKHDNPAKLLHHAFINRTKNYLDREARYNLFKHDNLDHVIESRETGITSTYINECLMAINDLLDDSELKLFRLYHVKGYKQKEIAVKLNVSKFDINRKVKALNNKLDRLKISYLYENRYVAYQSQGKKRQHKRKVLTTKEIIELSGLPFHLSVNDYTEQSKLDRDNLDLSKLPYDTCQGKKDITLDKSSYMVIANNNYTYNEVKVMIQNVYQGSDVIVNETKSRYKVLNNYRVKRVKRIETRKIWSQKSQSIKLNKQSRELFKGHKSYLGIDGIQK